MTSQHALGAGNSLNAWVDAGGLVQRAGEGFENSLSHVVGITTGEDIDMEIHSGIHGNRAQELLDELKRKGRPDRGHIGGGVVSQKWPPAQIHHRANERLVHRHIKKSVSADAGLVAKGFCNRLPKQDAGVLDRVVIINLDVAFGS